MKANEKVKCVFSLLSAIFLVLLCVQVTGCTSKQRLSKGILAYIHGGDLWVNELSDGQAKQLTTDGRNRSPHWSPSGQWLAYSKDDELWVVRPSGAEAKALSTVDKFAKFAWSPESDTLAYVRKESLCVASAGEWREQVLVNVNGIGEMAWSPDGEWLAYDVWPENTDYNGLWRIRSDSSNASELYKTDMPFAEGAILADWSPDGQNILFWLRIGLSAMKDGLPLYTIPAHGGESRELVDSMLLGPNFWAGSPNGKLLAITKSSGRFPWTRDCIAVVDSVSGKLTYLTDDKTAAISPAWSSDGQRIAYVAPDISFVGKAKDYDDYEAMVADFEAKVTQRRIWVMNKDGSDKRQLTNDAAYRDERPLWSADGSHILFVRLNQNGQASLWLMRNYGSELNKVVDEIDSEEYDYIEWNKYFDWWKR